MASIKNFFECDTNSVMICDSDYRLSINFDVQIYHRRSNQTAIQENKFQNNQTICVRSFKLQNNIV